MGVIFYGGPSFQGVGGNCQFGVVFEELVWISWSFWLVAMCYYLFCDLFELGAWASVLLVGSFPELLSLLHLVYLVQKHVVLLVNEIFKKKYHYTHHLFKNIVGCI